MGISRPAAYRPDGGVKRSRFEPGGITLHTVGVLAGDRCVTALDRCSRIALQAAPCGIATVNRDADDAPGVNVLSGE